MIHVISIELDWIKDEVLIKNLFELAKQGFANAMADKKLTHEVASTCYSLYKQSHDGDADDFEENKEKTSEERYNVWL